MLKILWVDKVIYEQVMARLKRRIRTYLHRETKKIRIPCSSHEKYKLQQVPKEDYLLKTTFLVIVESNRD